MSMARSNKFAKSFNTVIFNLLSLFCISLDFTLLAVAESYPIKLEVRAKSIVTEEHISLSEIAELQASSTLHDEAVIALGKITITKSPAPGQSLTITANQLLSRIKAEGGDISRIGYSIPQVFSVTRAARLLTLDEIRALVEEGAVKGNLDISVLGFVSGEKIAIRPDSTALEAIIERNPRNSKLSFTLQYKDSNSRIERVMLPLKVEEWTSVPVAKRALLRGETVTKDDLTMARLSMEHIPRDVALSDRSVVGYKTSSDLAYGDLFRLTKLEIPPLVANGSRVKLRYNIPGLEVTAIGTALESGVLSQEVRVRNDSSKKIVRGLVREEGLVEVLP
jgi:flagella basal body P-ring formation protein FlgA